MNTLILADLIADQREQFLARECGTRRHVDLQRYLNSRQIVVISGVRRCGKSTLLRQIAQHLCDAFHYLNLEDERLLGFEVGDFEEAMLAFGKVSDARVLLLDEIQNVAQWERFVRRVHDDGYKVFLTGSNAEMLSAELGTRLTGRYSLIELFPFDFAEVLDFRHIDAGRRGTAGRAAILRAFDAYLESGGLPEYLKYNDPEFLTRTYEDILNRDIIARFGLRDIRAFRHLAHYIYTNFTNDMSYNGAANALHIASPATARDYVGYLEQAYLAFEVFKYDYSLKKQHVTSKKVYVIDNGMRNMVAFRFSLDKGRLLENLVFLQLRRHGHKVYFYRDREECDFIVVANNRVLAAIQVCVELNDENRAREMKGLAAAVRQFKLTRGLILTYNQHETEDLFPGATAEILPTWRWMLEHGQG
jgi:hypothetical protein